MIVQDVTSGSREQGGEPWVRLLDGAGHLVASGSSGGHTMFCILPLS